MYTHDLGRSGVQRTAEVKSHSSGFLLDLIRASACLRPMTASAFLTAKWLSCRSFSCRFHRFEKEAFVAKEATSLSNELRSRFALGIRCDPLAIAPITFFVWKGEHRHGNIRGAIMSKSRKAHPNSVRRLSRNEISVMNPAIAFDKHNPSACIALKRTQLAQVERVPNLTCYRVSVRHCLFVPLQFRHP